MNIFGPKETVIGRETEGIKAYTSSGNIALRRKPCLTSPPPSQNTGKKIRKRHKVTEKYTAQQTTKEKQTLKYAEARHGGSVRKYSLWKAVHRRTGGIFEASLCYPAALSKAKFVDQNIKHSG